MNQTDQEHLYELERRLTVVRDRIRGVATRQHTGFYLYGRPGTSKTYTVRTTLEAEDISYAYQNGHLTPKGLFETIQANNDRVIVLDDVSTIFRNERARNILLAALGNQPGDTGVRLVTYRTSCCLEKVRFTGGIIAVSNLELHGNEVMEALKSRIHCLNYNPSDEQIIALLRYISEQGRSGLSPEECSEVCEYLLEECEERNVRPDVRLLVDKALKDFLLFKHGDAETHWRDLITTTLEEQLTALRHERQARRSRCEQMAHERQVAQEISAEYDTREERARAWAERTGKSEDAFYRRMRELQPA